MQRERGVRIVCQETDLMQVVMCNGYFEGIRLKNETHNRISKYLRFQMKLLVFLFFLCCLNG